MLGNQLTFLPWPSLTIVFWGLLTIMHNKHVFWPNNKLHLTHPRIGIQSKTWDETSWEWRFNHTQRLIGSWVVFNWGSHIYIYIYMDNHWVCLRSEGNPGFYQLQHVSSVTCPTGFIVGCTCHLDHSYYEPPTAIYRGPRADRLVPFFGGTMLLQHLATRGNMKYGLTSLHDTSGYQQQHGIKRFWPLTWKPNVVCLWVMFSILYTNNHYISH